MGDTAFVLVVDADVERGNALAQAARKAGHACHVVTSCADAFKSLRDRPPDVVVTAFDLGTDRTGVDVLRETKCLAPDSEVILLTPKRQQEQARRALGLGEHPVEPYDLIVEPIDRSVLLERIAGAATQAIASRQTHLLREQADQAFEFEGIIATSESLLGQIKRCQKLARSKCTVLITGETGTGKELFARAIHAYSPRAGRPFKVLNCAAVSETLLESELFGHIKGAFTGAVVNRKGLLHAAEGGTMFLDEIGDMPMTMQAKLLRALENGEVIPVGSNDAIYLDVRFLAATNRNLKDLVAKGGFREDLFYRLHAYGAIRIPPLRDRSEDIPVLVDRFLTASNRDNDLDIQGITPQALLKLMSHDWPGNVRELRNVVERMCIEAEGARLDVDDLPQQLKGGTEIVPASLPAYAGVLTMPEVERLHILNTLRHFNGNREKAAKALQIGTRTLYRKLKEYGIT